MVAHRSRHKALAEGAPSDPREADDRWLIEHGDESDPQAAIAALRERIKELNCLYGIAQLAERHPNSFEAIFAGVAERLPLSWQYPETACARILYRGRTFRSAGFALSPWRLSAPILIGAEPAGEVSVFYREERPPSFEGPFLREERTLINAVSDYLGLLARRIAAEQDLQETNRLLTVEREALRETNIALKTVLARIDEEKRELSRDIHANVEKVLLPILHALSLDLPARKRGYVDLLRRNMLDITTPFTNRLASAFQLLTPTELAICNMIRNGLRTKEIARLRGISPDTVSRHREHIRRKLGLAHRRLNLTTYLHSRAFEEDTPARDAEAAPPGKHRQ